jgi:hypothetical protein
LCYLLPGIYFLGGDFISLVAISFWAGTAFLLAPGPIFLPTGPKLKNPSQISPFLARGPIFSVFRPKTENQKNTRDFLKIPGITFKSSIFSEI